MSARLALGTVQFGLPYGITNSAGKVPPEEVARIVDLALAGGIAQFDTAALYGEAEEALGSALHGREAQVVTKTLPMSSSGVEAVNLRWRKSRDAFGNRPLYGLLSHRVEELLGAQGNALWQWMQARKAAGEVGKLGASVYTPQDVDMLLERFDVDLVQLPLNLLDRRMLNSGALARLAAAGVEVHVRSAFLQGLLLTPAERLPSSHGGLAPMLHVYEDFIAAHGLTRAQAALGFLRSLPEVGAIVVGVTRGGELQELLDAVQAPLPTEWPAIEVADEAMIDPRLWPARAA